MGKDLQSKGLKFVVWIGLKDKHYDFNLDQVEICSQTFDPKTKCKIFPPFITAQSKVLKILGNKLYEVIEKKKKVQVTCIFFLFQKCFQLVQEQIYQ